jgi:hypothetical protein
MSNRDWMKCVSAEACQGETEEKAECAGGHERFEPRFNAVFVQSLT